jgi:hypothetical protein
MGDEGVSDIVKWAESQGWTVDIDNTGYLRFYDPHGNYITYYPCTPKNPYRRRMDVLVRSRKLGCRGPSRARKSNARNAGRETRSDHKQHPS